MRKFKNAFVINDCFAKLFVRLELFACILLLVNLRHARIAVFFHSLIFSSSITLDISNSCNRLLIVIEIMTAIKFAKIKKCRIS